jgi:hypothetical protein
LGTLVYVTDGGSPRGGTSEVGDEKATRSGGPRTVAIDG